MLTRIIDPFEESVETSLDKYFCIKIKPQDTSNVIGMLNEVFPFDCVRHLKRIRNVKSSGYMMALVCKIDENTAAIEDIKSTLDEKYIPYDSICEVETPSRQPITKKQYESWNSIWPLVFHESMDEKIKMKQLETYTSIYRHFEAYFKDNNLALLIFESAVAEKIESSIEDLIVYESESLSPKVQDCAQCYPFDHVVMNALNGPLKNKRIVRNGNIPYLLSGCTAILLHEPCTMCSMALLHSRIDGVIYFNSNENFGALGSLCLLHSMDTLNHRFPVFKITP